MGHFAEGSVMDKDVKAIVFILLIVYGFLAFCIWNDSHQKQECRTANKDRTASDIIVLCGKP